MAAVREPALGIAIVADPNATPIASSGPSAVRASSRHQLPLTFDHIDSIGLKSGEYGGRKHAIAPADSIAATTPASLWADRLSITTISLGRRARRRSPPANACITDTSVPPS